MAEAARACSNQRRALIGSWVMPPLPLFSYFLAVDCSILICSFCALQLIKDRITLHSTLLSLLYETPLFNKELSQNNEHSNLSSPTDSHLTMPSPRTPHNPMTIYPNSNIMLSQQLFNDKLSHDKHSNNNLFHQLSHNTSSHY